MAKKIIRLNESNLIALIKESVRRVLNEGYDNLCPKLAAVQGRFGGFKQINLPDGVKLSDIENEDVKKITKNPKPEDKYKILLGSGDYAIISPNSQAIIKAEKEISDREALRAKIAAKKAGETPVNVPFESPQGHKERVKAEREVADRKNRTPKSLAQAREWVEKEFGRQLEFDTKRTRRGRDWAYAAHITFVAASYADGPDELSREEIQTISKWLAPLGFFYEGCVADHDERQWTSYGSHTWRRQGQFGTYDPTRPRFRNWEDEYDYYNNY